METENFQKKINLFLKPSENQEEDAILMLHAMRSTKKLIFSVTKLRFCVDYMLKVLLQRGYTDFNMVVRTIEIYSRWTKYKKPLETNAVRNIRKYVRYIFQPLKNLYENELSYDGLNLSADSADLNFTIAVVKFGYVYIPVYGCDDPRIVSLLVEFWLNASENMFVGELTVQDFNSMSQEILFNLNHSLGWMDNGNQRGFRRIFLILKVLKAVMLKIKREEEYEDYINCLKLYFSAIPEPFVSIDEIQDFVKYLFKNKVNKDYVVEIITDVYKNLFSYESSILFGPRSLKHLCRCAIRGIFIQEAKILPIFVKDLQIPETLKEFILGVPDYI